MSCETHDSSPPHCHQSNIPLRRTQKEEGFPTGQRIHNPVFPLPRSPNQVQLEDHNPSIDIAENREVVFRIPTYDLINEDLRVDITIACFIYRI